MKQIECNRLIADGASDEEIASLLEVPQSTVARWRASRLRTRKKTKRTGKPRRTRQVSREQIAIRQLKQEGFDMDTIKRVFGAVAVAVLLTVGALAQQHTPAPPVVDGDTVTLDGSIAWHDSGIDSMILQGGTLGLPGIYNSSGGTDPIRLRMPPGTHDITVLGFPDPGTNLRASVVQSVTIGEPTRVAQLVEAYRSLFAAQEAWRKAHEAIDAVAPTREEVIEALGIAFGGT